MKRRSSDFLWLAGALLVVALCVRGWPIPTVPVNPDYDVITRVVPGIQYGTLGNPDLVSAMQSAFPELQFAPGRKGSEVLVTGHRQDVTGFLALATGLERPPPPPPPDQRSLRLNHASPKAVHAALHKAFLRLAVTLQTPNTITLEGEAEDVEAAMDMAMKLDARPPHPYR